jgi:hypothetical protein
MEMGTVCESISATYVPTPPLLESRDRGVMQGHFLVDSPNQPTGSAKSNADLWLLTRDQFVAISSSLGEGRGPDRDVAAEEAGFSDWHVPFAVTKFIV